MTRSRPFVMLLVLVPVLQLASPGSHASDKGLTSELITTSVLFCTTTIADDLQPIVKTRRHLMIAKMSQESLARQLASMKASWRAAAEKHQAAIAALPLTPRLATVAEEPWLREVADQTWAEVQRQCPVFARTHGDAEVIHEFWRRHLPELAASQGRR